MAYKSMVWRKFLAFLVLFIAASNALAQTPPRRMLIDDAWLFHRGDISNQDNAVKSGSEDASWTPVDLPHDYVLDGKYSQSDKKLERNHGYLPYEVGWYRKHLIIPESAKGKVLTLDFDGVFRDAQVWLNGEKLGRHASGYTPFSFDISRRAKIGAENIITVRVDPTQWEGWWYEGGGIYRHVYLTALDPVHVAQYGTYVSSKISGDNAEVTIRTTVENSGSSETACEVMSEIVGPDGASLQSTKTSQKAQAGGETEITQKISLDHAKLWSFNSPNLYQLRTTIVVAGKPTDTTSTNFGIRTIRYDPNQGFFLNGEHVLIKGLACHQDLPAVGIAVPDSLQAWRVEQLKNAGCNAWRTAHNPPNEALLDACDRLGMMVMDENRHFGDAYSSHSPKGTTANDLSDLATMIRRDRNHPSIIMWSMCNEEGLQGSPEGAALFTAMMKKVHQYDDTRPITSAMNGGWLNKKSDADVEDIIGVNYNTNKYDAIHKRHPNKCMFGSECTNEKTARGEYEDNAKTGMRSAYNLSEKDWLAVVDRPWMAGSFTWTGFDYRGEPNPYGWPDISNNTGLVDVCGFPKDKFYYFQSCWIDKPMVHLVPATWNWPGKEGKDIRVLAWSNAKQVELFLNGKSLGTKDVPHDAHAEWQVPYEAGELTANAIADGKTVASDTVATTGAPARIKLTVERTALHANAEDAVVVQVSILDDKSRIVPNDDKRITFALKGDGKLLGTGNGNPADHDPDRADNRKTFHGRAIAIIMAGKQTGTIQLTATSPGLSEDKLSFNVP